MIKVATVMAFMGAKKGTSKKDSTQQYMIATFFDIDASESYEFYIRPQDINLQNECASLKQLKLCNVELKISSYQNKGQIDLWGVEAIK